MFLTVKNVEKILYFSLNIFSGAKEERSAIPRHILENNLILPFFFRYLYNRCFQHVGCDSTEDNDIWLMQQTTSTDFNVVQRLCVQKITYFCRYKKRNDYFCFKYIYYRPSSLKYNSVFFLFFPVVNTMNIPRKRTQRQLKWLWPPSQIRHNHQSEGRFSVNKTRQYARTANFSF